MEENVKDDGSDLSRRDFQKLLGVSGAAVLGGVSLAGCQGESTAAIACPYCEETFESESGLKDHLPAAHEAELRAAIGDGPYQCPYGEEEFETLEGLRAHIKEAHAADLDVGLPDEWDETTDVVVVGYGGAGVVAAIEAAENGASVTVLEKMERPGGSTAMSGGLFLTPDSPSAIDDTVAYLRECARGQVSEEMARTFAEEAVSLPDWFQNSLGVDELVPGFTEGYHTDFEGYDAIRSWTPASGGGGPTLFNQLSTAAEDRGVDVFTETPVTELYVDPNNRVVGVKADRDGEFTVKAERGVILTCGGIDYNESLKKQNFRAWPKYSVGNPGNTGDAVELGSKAGAQLWKMSELCGNSCHKFPGEEIAYFSALRNGMTGKSAFVVNTRGNRFVDERISYDSFHKKLNDYDPVENEFPNIPCYIVFDEETRQSGPIGYGNWSEDNSEELEKGWIESAESIRGLASSIGVDPGNLERTYREYNTSAEEGTPGPFGREGKKKLRGPPFYAIETYPGIFGAWGGPRIDTNAQVCDYDDDPIPGLYAAGNASSGVLKFLYPVGGGCIGDAFTFGRIAGREAATE